MAFYDRVFGPLLLARCARDRGLAVLSRPVHSPTDRLKASVLPALYTVYLLLCEDGSLYTGIARDVDKRFEKHVSGAGARYTRAHPPDKIIYTEPKRNKSHALKRELEIKKLSRAEKLKLAGL